MGKKIKEQQKPVRVSMNFSSLTSDLPVSKFRIFLHTLFFRRCQENSSTFDFIGENSGTSIINPWDNFPVEDHK